ncbi:glycosyltransferase [uncultured Thermanaerothrix sp.]|uniref:glycosyltransferase n=1 Tax=uncultured Thermanaerothrix sp. TaxID=1195149 RepID=UPI0026316208|nr:glycosyltransferase [uncultured Thermanaerothrix sp.]
MLNVAMISFHTCPLATLGGKDTGGMNVYVAELTRHLGQMGIHVDVFTRSQDEHVPHVLHNLGYGNRVVHVPAGPEKPLPKSELYTYLDEFSRGVSEFAQNKHIHYHLVHSHYWLSGLVAERLKREWNVPVVHMFHTLGVMKNRVARSPSEHEPPVRLEKETHLVQTVDHIVAATPAEKAQLEFLYHTDSRKISIIPPGVDVGRFYPIPKDEARAFVGVPDEARMILFVGRIEPLKGIETLIRALRLIQDTGRLACCPHYLAIIGGNPPTGAEQMDSEMTRLQRLAKQLGVKDVVLFLGKQAQESLPYYYSAADVLVLPSHYESFGMVALEAMACGTPVIASQVGGLPFLVRDGVTGFVIPDGEPAILADRLTQLILDSNLREQMGKRAVEHAQPYAWTKIVRQIVRLYERLLTLQTAPPGLVAATPL